LTIIIHAVGTSAYAARLAGVRTQRPALASSLYNVMALSSRGASLLSSALLGAVTDAAVVEGTAGALLPGYRVVLLGATGGTLLAGLFIPTLSRLLARGVEAYARQRSLPRVIVQATSVRGLWQLRAAWMPPRPDAVRHSRRLPLPKRFVLAIVLVVALRTVGDLAALYASAVVPTGARTALRLAPLVTLGATFLTLFVVDPIAALINDETLRRDRPLPDATYVTIWQVGARLVGTLLAQLFLLPSGHFLAAVTRWLVRIGM
jgi:hypothetical protein